MSSSSQLTHEQWPVFSEVDAAGHESILFGHDEETGLRTIIAIHSTALGPALGGTRFYPYGSEHHALNDVLRLSAGMSLKSAAAGLELGGGKAVIVGDPALLKGPDLLHAYGRAVDRLGGAYITAEDVGTTVEDMRIVGESTRWVTGLPLEAGGSGDPSPLTAVGVIAAMRATATVLWGSTDLAGRRVVVQGVGKVGADLARLLVGAGAEVMVSDISAARVGAIVDELGITAVAPGEVFDAECDIFAPCALGAVLSRDTIPRLRCRAVVGSANNQLDGEPDAELLAERGILYVPDFVANAGGIINISVELRPEGYDPTEAERRVEHIFDTTLTILEAALRDGGTPWSHAVALAAERIAHAPGTDATT